MLEKCRYACRAALRYILLVVGLGAWSVAQTAIADTVFIGDVGDNSVKSFDTTSGGFSGTFVAPKSAGLKGPMGMIFTDGQLVLVNQNSAGGSSGQRGEILRFDGTTGTFIGKLVASSDRDAPFAPQGLVRGGPDNAYYVADFGDQSKKCTNEGNVKAYDNAGAFLGNLDRHVFTAEFHPRGVVYGPDGLLYVSAVGCLDPTDALYAPLTGYILRFNASTKQFVDVFASNATVPSLHRPEGLVFDSKGNLWVTSFRDNADSNDTDKILKLDGKTGRLLDTLPLWTSGSSRAFAQAILFGPGGKLFVPITGNAPDTAGQVRRCDIATKQCDVIVQAGGVLQSPWFLIFRSTDPSTLNYMGQ
jgi:sugar lactone lactonase YvrE